MRLCEVPIPRLWRRVLAEAIDVILVTVAASYLLDDVDLSELDSGAFLDLSAEDLAQFQDEGGLSVSVQLLELLVRRSALLQWFIWQHAALCLYHTLAIYFTQTTIGKAMVGVRVVSNSMALQPNGVVEARGPTLYYSLVRAVTKTLSWLCCIVFAASLIDPTGQGVHDTLSGTLVVRKPRRGEVHLPGGLGVALRDDGVYLRRPAPAGGDRAGRND